MICSYIAITNMCFCFRKGCTYWCCSTIWNPAGQCWILYLKMLIWGFKYALMLSHTGNSYLTCRIEGLSWASVPMTCKVKLGTSPNWPASVPGSPLETCHSWMRPLPSNSVVAWTWVNVQPHTCPASPLPRGFGDLLSVLISTVK